MREKNHACLSNMAESIAAFEQRCYSENRIDIDGAWDLLNMVHENLVRIVAEELPE